MTANSDRPDVRAEIAEMILEGLVRVEPVRGDRERVRVVPVRAIDWRRAARSPVADPRLTAG